MIVAVILSAAGISVSVLLGARWVAEAASSPPTFAPERKIEPDPKPIEEEPDLGERKIEPDPTPVGGHTKRVVRL